MPKNTNLTSKDLEKKIDLLVKRFKEQKGIIDSYIKRERDWKKDKVLHRKELSRLEKDLKKFGVTLGNVFYGCGFCGHLFSLLSPRA